MQMNYYTHVASREAFGGEGARHLTTLTHVRDDRSAS